MRIALFLLFILTAAVSKEAAAQDFDARREYFFVVRVSYSIKTTGIKANFYADPVFGPGHPLSGKVKVPQNDVLIITNSEGKDITLTSLSQLLDILSWYGFSLKFTHDIYIMKETYKEYIFIKF